MTIVVFCGPTLSQSEIREEIDALVMPPAMRGDVLRATELRPSAIGLIDGYFDRVPSVWHKEILWAMSQGTHVFGASSMGALRAAELSCFGMEGIGAVFDGFRRGTLEDDDEVAVAHATEEAGYRLMSEAMVNIRATLRSAEENGIVPRRTREILEATAKDLPYPDRSYPALFRLARESSIPGSEIDVLEQWLPQGRIDQKRIDALAMLREMRARDAAGWTPKTVEFTFAHTGAWASLVSELGVETSARSSGSLLVREPAAVESGIVDELLVAERHASVCEGALARAICQRETLRSGLKIDARAVEAVAEEFRRERGLLDGEAFDRWLESEHLEDDELVPFFRREALFRRTRTCFAGDVHRLLTDQLRCTGEYGAVWSRANAKRTKLSRMGLETPNLEDTKLSESELWRWYFVDRLHRDPPSDLAAYAHRQCTDIDGLRQAAIREYCFAALEEV